ncbi:MAG: N-acetyl-gamma-glutamyl-phosphate reductase [Lachnospiraceae bacterium]|nr:N-acetyl-gamma-glutamyl-phosphate reductase [Lachnospiraceae bacterium]
MKKKVYIDGQSGTTGLQIYERIGAREDLDLLRIDEDKRHDLDERKKFLNSADIVFLCLPDAGAIEAVSLIDNPEVRVIDASTAHRTDPNWVYGFPELSKAQRQAIRESKRIANPGCHATGMISVTAPLVNMGILPKDYPVTCFSLTGYSGGGKKMIADYEAEGRAEKLSAPGIYGLTLKHKHIPEMTKMTGLTSTPVFLPVVDDYYKGMASTIMLQNRLLNGQPTAEEICQKLQEYYADEHFVKVLPFEEARPTIYANTLAGTNRLEIAVCGNADQTTITALFDNLGKGASGAAVQNMNILLGLDETIGLE